MICWATLPAVGDTQSAVHTAAESVKRRGACELARFER